jgi:hypothetical protein
MAAADELAELRKHVERLEKRLAKLEGEPAPKGSPAAKAAAKPKKPAAAAKPAAQKPSPPGAKPPESPASG